MIPPGKSDNMEWLPLTKLAFGTIDENILLRDRLLAALHEAIARFRLTLLSAPPGYGKSTLLTSWHQWNNWLAQNTTDGEVELTPIEAAYLALDASENDRTHFLLALIAALQTLHPECGSRAKRFLTQNGYPELVDSAAQIEVLTGLIVIDITQFLPARFVLILDNYEQIREPAVHNVLNYLLRRLPPQARVVVSTTQDPPFSLAKLTAHGLATILRADALAFEEAESITLLERVIGLHLPAEHHMTLHRYTEGWPVGLILLAQELQSLSPGTARTQFIASLDSGRDPPWIWPSIDAYLRQETFDRLPRHLQTFLMKTSILPALTAEACQALTGREDAAQIVQEMYQKNLFLFRHTPAPKGDLPSNHAGSAAASASWGVYRYHTLFGNFLRHRLYLEMPNQALQLHRRAAEIAQDPLQKVRHYLAARCWTEAIHCIRQVDGAGPWTEHVLANLPRDGDELADYLYQKVHDMQNGTQAAAARLGLTARQFEVLTLLGQGVGNHAIAERLCITLPTVKEHVGHIMRKLEVANRHEAVRRAIELGLVSAPRNKTLPAYTQDPTS